jgi:beta-1,4-mannooligosaccharide/beta-1,4-mannosyl-N-acetylglucosamine phosphorylase
MKNLTFSDAVPSLDALWQPRPDGCTDPVWRYAQNPVIGRNPLPGVARVFNSGVVTFDGKFVGVFRGESTDGLPRLYYGESTDGLNWKLDPDRITFTKGDKPFYSYDPRVVRVEDTYYVIWCTDFDGCPTLGIARTTDFKRYERLPNGFLPFNRNGVLFPEKINGKFVMLSRPSDNGHTNFGNIFSSESPDLIHFGNHKLVMPKNPKGEWWSSVKIGAGPAPIRTKDGWLLIYHGVAGTCNGFVYSMGAALLDLNDPSKVKARADSFLLTPETEYEERGFVPNVVFPCAALKGGDGKLVIYYGAADTYLCLAFSTVDGIIDYIKKHS